MKNLENLEKKINSELTTKINKTYIKHNQLYIEINKYKNEIITWTTNRALICNWCRRGSSPLAEQS